MVIFFPEHEQKVTAEISNAQRAKIVKCKERKAETDVARAEGWVEGDPGASNQKERIHQMNHDGAQRHAQFAGVAEVRSPTNSDKEKGHHRSQSQQGDGLSALLEQHGEGTFLIAQV